MLEQTCFELEGLPGVFAGWHDPDDRWNGFANPLFSHEESEKLALAFNHETGDGPRYSVVFVPEADVFRVSFVEVGELVNTEKVSGSDVQGAGHVYDWGHGWCWLEEEAWR